MRAKGQMSTLDGVGRKVKVKIMYYYNRYAEMVEEKWFPDRIEARKEELEREAEKGAKEWELRRKLGFSKSFSLRQQAEYRNYRIRERKWAKSGRKKQEEREHEEAKKKAEEEEAQEQEEAREKDDEESDLTEDQS